MTDLGDRIRELRANGLTYSEIQAQLECSKGTISYYVGEGQKNKHIERQKKRRHTVNGSLEHKTDVFMRKPAKSVAKQKSGKVSDFCREIYGDRGRSSYSFTYEDVLSKYGADPICYLTGDLVDLSVPSSYEFDHIVPRSKGGKNVLENLGIVTREANRAKANLSVEEFLVLCEKVLRHYGRI